MENSKSIVACISTIPLSDSICDYSSWLSLKLKKKVKLFHTLDHPSTAPVSDLSGNIGLGSRDELLEELVAVEHEQNKILLQKAKIILESAKRRAEKNGIGEPEILLRHGRFQESLLEIIDEIEAVVIGRYGQNHQNAPLSAVGHNVEAVIRSLEKPVLVVSKPFTEPKSALFAFDGSTASNKVLDYLVENALFQGIDLHLIHVGERSITSETLMNEAALRFKTFNQPIQLQFLSGETNEALLNYLEHNNISMTVMGAFGHHWLRGLIMGSFTSKMLALSEKPLLLIR